MILDNISFYISYNFSDGNRFVKGSTFDILRAQSKDEKMKVLSRPWSYFHGNILGKFTCLLVSQRHIVDSTILYSICAILLPIYCKSSFLRTRTRNKGRVRKMMVDVFQQDWRIFMRTSRMSFEFYLACVLIVTKWRVSGGN